jgi:hypothetical protein
LAQFGQHLDLDLLGVGVADWANTNTYTWGISWRLSISLRRAPQAVVFIYTTDALYPRIRASRISISLLHRGIGVRGIAKVRINKNTDSFFSQFSVQRSLSSSDIMIYD